MRSVFAKIASWLGLLLLGVGATGCCTATNNWPHQFDTITVTLDDSLRDASNTLPRIEVNLVAANDTDLARWQKVPVSQYFQSNHAADTTVVLILGQDQTSQSISSSGSDPASKDYINRIWGKKEKNLVVLCDYPPSKPGIGSDDDTRRLILQTTCFQWPDNQKELKLRISSLGLTVTTPPRPHG
jgi:hypothetical protein